jgi:hypothetical protein
MAGKALRRKSAISSKGDADVGEGPGQRFDVQLGLGGLLLDGHPLGSQLVGGAFDKSAGGLVHRSHLFENNLLVGQRQGDGDGDGQGRDGDIHRPVDAFHQLLVVADDQFDGQHPLLVDGELLLQVDDPLAQGEEQLLLDEAAAWVVGGDVALQGVNQALVDELTETDGLFPGER